MAAGLGSRMLPLTETTPKPLVSIAGLTLIERLIESFRAADITTITIGVGWLGDQIIELLEQSPYSRDVNCVSVNNYQWGPLQTLVTTLEHAPEGHFVACPADMFVESSLVSSFISNHLNCSDDREISLAVDPGAIHGSVVYGDVIGAFTKIAKQSTDKRFEIGRSAMIISGHSSINKKLEQIILDGERTVAGALNKLSVQKGTVGTIPIKGFWHDIDTADDLLRILPHILEGTEPSGDSIIVHKGDSIEIGENISMQSGIELKKGVHIIGPAFIGRNSVIEAEATLGPQVSLAQDTLIPKGCRISTSILFNRPILRINAHLRNTIAHANAKIHGENQDVTK